MSSAFRPFRANDCQCNSVDDPHLFWSCAQWPVRRANPWFVRYGDRESERLSAETRANIKASLRVEQL